MPVLQFFQLAGIIGQKLVEFCFNSLIVVGIDSKAVFLNRQAAWHLQVALAEASHLTI